MDKLYEVFQTNGKRVFVIAQSLSAASSAVSDAREARLVATSEVRDDIPNLMRAE